MKNVDIIEVRVMPYSVGREGGRAYGNTAMFEVYAESGNREGGEFKARSEARPFCLLGLAVIVRPKYNDGVSMCFHEWRSFNGGDFEKVVFHCCGNDPKCKA